jgi:uncharacterized protein YlxW (UPF0749 family)
MATMTKGSERWLLPLSAILLVMGGLVGLQVHTQSLRGETEIGRRTSALGEMLRSNQTQVEAYKKEIGDLRTRLAKYETTATKDEGMSQLITEELQTSRAALGLVPLRGPGITLEISDSTLPAIKGVDAEPFLVHDWDLIQLLNELWADDAEAISVNGQRIVLGSSVICSGRLVQVNHVPISAPFVFTAIGAVDNLVSGLNIRNGVLDTMKGFGLKVKLTAHEQVELPAVSVAPKFQFARPVIKETTQEVTQ